MKDLTNQAFGRLIAKYATPERRNGNVMWYCECSCGGHKIVRSYDLTSGKTQSCGCLQKEKASKIGKITGSKNNIGKITFKDLTGQRFGKLQVIKQLQDRKNNYTVWKCLCDCGNYTNVRSHDLLSGNTTSCGCIKSKGETIIAQLLRDNNISFVKEQTFDSCVFQGKLRFDFYINNFYLIEYDGIQHFKEVEFFHQSLEEINKIDNYKNQWCKENNIPLIRIPYTILNTLTIEDLLIDKSKYVI